MDKYKKLIDVHLQHRIWRNELEMALMEIDFWEDLVGKIEQNAIDAPQMIDMVGQLHHYQRLSQQLLADVQEQEMQVAFGVKNKRVLTPPTLDDYTYLREEMIDFHANFHKFKTKIREFVISQPSV